MNTGKIEDSYELSPLQQGMLFHSIYAPESGVNIEQIVCAFHENLNIPAFEQAWQEIVKRHTVLRTAFRWKENSEPAQDVYKNADIFLEYRNWQDLPKQEIEERLNSWLREDRQSGFDLTCPPLMRLSLFQLNMADFRFVWTFYHALLDYRSLLMLLKEVFAFYDSACKGQSLSFYRIRPYRDYIEWLQCQDLAGAEAFWQKTLCGIKAPTQLMMDRNSLMQADSTNAYGMQQILIPEALTSALKSLSLACQHDLPLEILVYGAWALLSSRYSGEKDQVFGIVTGTHGRSAIEWDGSGAVKGLLINTLPARINVHPEMLLQTWLKEIHALIIKIKEYEHTPLTKIREWTDVPQDMPLFETVLIFEDCQLNFELQNFELQNFELQNFELESGNGNLKKREFKLLEQTNYPLTLAAYNGTSLLLKIEYDRTRFEDSTISRMTGHLETIFKSIVSNPAQPLSDIPILTEAERHRLLIEWNDTRTDFPGDICLHELFEAQVQKTPNLVAVTFEDEHITYETLNRRANQLAHHLVDSLGLKPEDRVGICVERSVEMIVGLLGILKAGGAYVPLDPGYPEERLSFMLEDAGAPLVITHSSQAGRFKNSLNRQMHVLCLDTEAEAISKESEKNSETDIKSKNLAYIIYTSGSTGKPKGVQINHRSVVNLTQTTSPVFQFDKQDVWTVFHSYGFDLSVWEIWTPLLCGSRLVVVPLGMTRSPFDFYDLLSKERVTVLNQTPSAVRQLLDVRDEAIKEGRGWDVRLIICGGEALPRDLALDLLKWDIPLWNFYGPTEATVWSSIYKVENLSVTGGDIPVGRPLGNTLLYILDDRLDCVPVGVPGELHIGGAGLARGYYNRPELTREKFIPNPFAENGQINERLYKTGDLARYRHDGNIEFLGRIDHQVKIRGFRIELGEIETVLNQHPDVRESVVLEQEIVSGDKRLIAYIVMKKESRFLPTRCLQDSLNSASSDLHKVLHDFLQSKLPEYMLPAAFILIEAVPLTPNGKIDRNALSAPDSARPVRAGTYTAPKNHVEELLVDIWKDMLRIDRIGIHDNFFKSGGHSLLATRLMSKIYKTFQVEIPLRSLFEAKTVAAQSRLLIKHENVSGQVMATARLRRQIDKMTPDEIEAMIREKKKNVNRKGSDS